MVPSFIYGSKPRTCEDCGYPDLDEQELNARTLWMEPRFVNEIKTTERTVGAALRGRPALLPRSSFKSNEPTLRQRSSSTPGGHGGRPYSSFFGFKITSAAFSPIM